MNQQLVTQYGVLTATSQHIGDGLVACDLTGVIYFLNRAMEPLAPTSSWAGQEMTGLLEHLAVFPAGEGPAMLRRLYSEQPLMQRELRRDEKTWRATLTRIDDGHGRPIGIVGVFTDVSDLYQLARTREEMMSMLAHEFRTPLTAIIAAGELLADDLEAIDGGPPEALQILEAGASQMQRLIDDLLQVTRLEAGALTLHPCDVMLNEVVASARRIVQAAAEGKGMTVVATVPPGLSVHGDPERLVQIIANLLGNAVKYSPSGATVWIAAVQEPFLVRVEVKDEGAGIPADEQVRLFTKFIRGSNIAQTTPGTGLGLVIVRRLVEAQGGTISVESAEGRGTRFAFTVPISRATAVAAGDV